jgi:hypothetical protein
MNIAVLFARRDSVYKTFADCDVYDVDRDARNFSGYCPVVAHPPCRARGRYKAFAKPLPHEKELARFAVRVVRQNGGVLEHPAHSDLWKDMSLPKPGDGADFYGGWSLDIAQCWWGHKAEKRTWLYIFGIPPKNLPVMPFVLGRGTHVIGKSRWGRASCKRPEVSKAEREHTPPELAAWLVQLARLSHGSFAHAQ